MARSTVAPVDLLASHLDALALYLGIDRPAREVYGIPGRRYRFDFAFLPQKTAIEYDGGTQFMLPSHTSPKHLDRDREKLILGQLAGWLVIPVTSSMVTSGKAVDLIERALTLRMDGK